MISSCRLCRSNISSPRRTTLRTCACMRSLSSTTCSSRRCVRFMGSTATSESESESESEREREREREREENPRETEQGTERRHIEPAERGEECEAANVKREGCRLLNS